MKRIAIDMDEVMADLIPKHLKLYNENFGEALTLEDLHGQKLREVRPHAVEELRGYLSDPGFFRDLEVMEDAQDVIRELHEDHEIFITTAAMEFPTSFNAKYEWLKEHFSFLNDLNFVFCGDKGIINADYLIDDNARHFKRFEGTGLLFTSPHNIHVTGYKRVDSWGDVREYFLNS